MVLVFLDIDSVLRPQDAPLYRFAPQCRAAFEDTLAAVPTAGVAISSSWKSAFSLEEIRAHFSAGVRSRLLGVTPTMHPPVEFVRYHEIRSYLRHSSLAPCPWLAIDDDAANYTPDLPALLVVDGSVGFDHDARERMIQFLARERTS